MGSALEVMVNSFFYPLDSARLTEAMAMPSGHFRNEFVSIWEKCVVKRRASSKEDSR